MEHTPDEKLIEEKLNSLQPSPSQRFYRRMRRAAWTPAAASRRRAVAATSLTFLLIAALLIFTPQGRAWAQGLLNYFTRAGSDTLPAPTMATMRWVEQTPGVPASTLTPVEPTQLAFSADCGDYSAPKCTVEQIRSKVDFTVKQLGTIPDGFYFTGATGGPGRIEIFYDTADHGGVIYISEAPWTGSPEQTSWEIGASAVVENVQIGSLAGEYVEGTFMMKDGDSEMVWHEDADVQTMHWVDHGVFFVMQTAGPSFPLDPQALTTLAESLTTGPVAAASLPMPPTATPDPQESELRSVYPLTVAQAEEKAGFDVLEPTKLPEFLSWIGARYEAEQKTVNLFYHLNLSLSIVPPNDNGLYLSEHLAPDPANGTPWGFRLGDSNAMMADNTYSIVGGGIQTVQINAVPGQYVEGVWAGKNNDGTWAWEPVPSIKRLRWQVNGMAFEMDYYGDEITQADMIAIAESMK